MECRTRHLHACVCLDMHMQICLSVWTVKHIYSEVELPDGHHPMPLRTDHNTSTGLQKQRCNYHKQLLCVLRWYFPSQIFHWVLPHIHWMCLRPLVAAETEQCVISLCECVFPKFPSKPEHHQTSKRQIVGSLVSREVPQPKTQWSSTEQRSLVLPSSLALVCLTHLLPDKYKEPAPSLG